MLDKANPKQGQLVKTKPECNICFGKFHNLAECPIINSSAESKTAFNALMAAAKRTAQAKTNSGPTKQRFAATVAALSDTLAGADIDSSDFDVHYFVDASEEIISSVIEPDRPSLDLYDPGAMATVFNDIDVFETLDLLSVPKLRSFSANAPVITTEASGHIPGHGPAYYIADAMNLI